MESLDARRDENEDSTSPTGDGADEACEDNGCGEAKDQKGEVEATPSIDLKEVKKAIVVEFGALADLFIDYHRIECEACRSAKTKHSTYNDALLCIHEQFYSRRRNPLVRLYIEDKLAQIRARAAVQEGTHLQVMRRAMDCVHVGDRELKLLHLLAAVTVRVKTPRRIRMPQMLRGQSQSGKSHLHRETGRFIPPENWLAINSMSSKSLYYMCKDTPDALADVTVSLDEAADQEDATLNFLKALTSYDIGEMVHFTVINKKYESMVIAPLPNVFSNAAELELNERTTQLLNRFYISNVSESQEITDEVALFQADEDVFGSRKVRDRDVIETAKEIVKIVMEEEDFDCRIPFAKLIPFSFENRINRPKFSDMVRASAYFHRHNRPKWEGLDGETIYFSTLMDYKLALEIWLVIEGYTIANLDEKCFEVWRRLSYGERLGTSEVVVRCRNVASDSSVRRKLTALVESGLVARIERVRKSRVDENGDEVAVWFEDEWYATRDPLSNYSERGYQELEIEDLFSRLVKSNEKTSISETDFISYLYTIIYNVIINNNNRSFHKIEKSEAEEAARGLINPVLSLSFWDFEKTLPNLNTMDAAILSLDEVLSIEKVHWPGAQLGAEPGGSFHDDEKTLKDPPKNTPSKEDIS